MRLPMALWRGERITVLTVNGRLDPDNVSVLEVGLEGALACDARTAAVDLKRVDSVDASGIMALLDARDMAESRGCRLILLNVRADVAAQLSEAGVDRVIDVYGTGFDSDGPPPVVVRRPVRARS